MIVEFNIPATTKDLTTRCSTGGRNTRSANDYEDEGGE
jgi:hypothetical protein